MSPVAKLISPAVFPLFGQINTSRAIQPESRLVVKVRLRRTASPGYVEDSYQWYRNLHSPTAHASINYDAVTVI